MFDTEFAVFSMMEVVCYLNTLSAAFEIFIIWYKISGTFCHLAETFPICNYLFL